MTANAPDVIDLELVPEDNARLALLCGPLDQNLRLIEQRLAVELRRRGNQFRISGARAGAAERVLRDLFELTAGGGELDLPDVHLALREHEEPTADATQRAAGPRPPAEDGVARRAARPDTRARAAPEAVSGQHPQA